MDEEPRLAALGVSSLHVGEVLQFFLLFPQQPGDTGLHIEGLLLV